MKNTEQPKFSRIEMIDKDFDEERAPFRVPASFELGAVDDDSAEGRRTD